MTLYVRRPDAPAHGVSSAATEGLVVCGPREEAASDVHLRAVETPPQSSGPSSTPHTDTRTRVLLVDDDPMVLRSIGRVLRQRGYEVTTAINGEDATQIVDKQSFDV